MIRAWIAVALLAGSWMFGLGFFYPANPWIFAVLVAGAVALFGGFIKQLPSGGVSAISVALLIPAIIFTPWPLKVMPLLVAAGLAMQMLPSPNRYPSKSPTESWMGERLVNGLACGAIAAGVVMAAQMLGLAVYTAQTARSHELPKPMPDLLAGIANLLSIDAAADDSSIVVQSTRQVHRLGATWELLLDPVTLCFFIGGLALTAIVVWQELPPGKRWIVWVRSLRIFSLIIIVWLPVRAGLLLAVYMYRVLRADPDRALYVMNHFFSPWVLLVLLAIPILLVWRFLKPTSPLPTNLRSAPGEVQGEGLKSSTPPDNRHILVPLVLIALAVALFTAGIQWNPVGKRLAGRVKFVERHSTWEPTIKPYDTTWYGELSGYNYAAIYAYLGQYYTMSRLLEDDKIDDQTLSQCDVLVIKTPTARYSKDEAAAVLRFVQNGGGVLFIGDHTNIYRMGTIMNDMIRPMGFVFRDDILFSNESSAYDQHFNLPWTVHPSLQYMPPMDFAGSCSIDPGFSHGRSTITNTGLWSMDPEYHHENYFPIAEYCPEMRYGAFIQAWAAWYGQGRAMAFTDSTIFSNFATFQPGKAELMLGMIEWLNHAGPPLDPQPWLILLGLAPLCWGILISYRRSVSWLVLLAAGMCGWALANEGVAYLHRWSMPLPKINKPMTRIVIDRTASDVPLSKGAYIEGDGVGYGLLEQWIGRLGYYTIRLEGKDAFSGNALVAVCPDRQVTALFEDQLKRYVADGGKLLVFDSPENTDSTANYLLSPFGLSIKREQPVKGALNMVDKWPGFEVAQAKEVVGGRPIARIGERPVAAIVQHGKGAVLAVGFSSILNDKMMGGDAQWMVEPDAALRLRYEVLYSLVRLLVEDKPITPSEESGAVESGKTKSKLELPDLPMLEHGLRE